MVERHDARSPCPLGREGEEPVPRADIQHALPAQVGKVEALPLVVEHRRRLVPGCDDAVAEIDRMPPDRHLRDGLGETLWRPGNFVHRRNLTGAICDERRRRYTRCVVTSWWSDAREKNVRPLGRDLDAELATGPDWMYPWPLGRGIDVPLI